MKFSISVIICAYTLTRWDALIEAVISVQQQTLLPDEIIVVIDHNETLLARVQAEIKGVVALPNTGTNGLSAARNSGVTAAHSQIIAFLDDDAIASPQWLSLLCARYSIDPQVAGSGGAVLPLWPTETRPSWFPEEFRLGGRLYLPGCADRRNNYP